MLALHSEASEYVAIITDKFALDIQIIRVTEYAEDMSIVLFNQCKQQAVSGISKTKESCST
jgi:hypothetical protein